MKVLIVITQYSETVDTSSSVPVAMTSQIVDVSYNTDLSHYRLDLERQMPTDQTVTVYRLPNT